MSGALRQTLTLIESDPELRRRLVRDPKGTVLYAIPDRLGSAHGGLTPDDQLDLVGFAEAFPDSDALLRVIQAWAADLDRSGPTRRS